MTDKFAKLERPATDSVLRVIGFFLLLAICLAYTWQGTSPTPVSGVIQSAGPVSFGKYNGGTQQAASVRLADGTVVQAYVTSGGFVKAGDKVRLLKDGRLFGGATHYIVADERNEP